MGSARRAHAAQLNSFEVTPAFAAAVIVAHLVGNAELVTINVLAVLFITSRLLYIICYLADWAILRSLVWFVGMGSIVSFFCGIGLKERRSKCRPAGAGLPAPANLTGSRVDFSASGTCGTRGNAAPFGHSIQICPCCFMSPASCPAASPVPQNRSARTSPAIAPPVSCAATGRTSAVPSGLVVDNHNRLPSGITLRSTAAL